MAGAQCFLSTAWTQASSLGSYSTLAASENQPLLQARGTEVRRPETGSLAATSIDLSSFNKSGEGKLVGSLLLLSCMEGPPVV